jgi:hypothetical protein
MKTKLIISAVVSIFLIGISFNTNAQGAEISKELRSYIDSEASMPSGIKIIPGDTTTTKDYYDKDKTYSIGGQVVDDANSVVYKAFNLNSDWSEMTVVADWTGSMYTYVGQIMKWHKNNIEKNLLENIVLFNDGDDRIRQSYTKEIGKTGGIYYTDPNDMEVFLKTVEIAIDNGDGGDAEENDVEAIIAAIEKYPDIEEVVLIADNTAIRDISLVDKIKIPVHVILCNGGWVYDYVKLAYSTGGSIITLTDNLDFSDKSKIDKTNIILNGVKYNIK